MGPGREVHDNVGFALVRASELNEIIGVFHWLWRRAASWTPSQAASSSMFVVSSALDRRVRRKVAERERMANARDQARDDAAANTIDRMREWSTQDAGERCSVDQLFNELRRLWPEHLFAPEVADMVVRVLWMELLPDVRPPRTSSTSAQPRSSNQSLLSDDSV